MLEIEQVGLCLGLYSQRFEVMLLFLGLSFYMDDYSGVKHGFRVTLFANQTR